MEKVDAVGTVDIVEAAMGNTYGNIFRLTTFGESHGPTVGGVLDGMPAGVTVDMEYLQAQLDRRRPGQSRLTTARKEADKVEILSGVFEGKTTGCPIGFMVRNTNHHSQDYENMKEVFRPSHADYTYFRKYGIRDYRGGGRSSARETLSRVVGGAFAMMALRQLLAAGSKCSSGSKGSIVIKAYVQQVGDIVLPGTYKDYDLSRIDDNPVRCPDEATAQKMADLIWEVKGKGDTIGGVIACVIKGCPVGLGEPCFGKLHAALGAGMLSINAVKGFEYGQGFNNMNLRGSKQNDRPLPKLLQGEETLSLKFATNNSGGIQGGISNGEDIYFRVAFKPVATLLMEQETVDIHGNATTLNARGRHDACVLPRAVPVVEAMAAMTILDYYLMQNAQCLMHN